MNILPTNTTDLLILLDRDYPDKYEVEGKEVGTPEYWKRAGVIELIRHLKHLQSKGKTNGY